MTLSEKQLTANRRNAQRSTGPRTPEGKHTASRNRLVHGIRSRDLVLHSEGERPDDFDALRDALHDEHAPATPTEELLVDQIAALHWRARRVLRAEAGSIRVAVDDAITESINTPRDDLQSNLRHLDSLGGGENPYGAAVASRVRAMICEHSLGQDMLLHVLRSARPTIAAGTRLDPELRQRIIDFLGPDAELSTLLALPEYGASLLPPEPLLAALDTHVAAAEACRDELRRQEEQALDRLTASLSLPPADIADRILRYDTTLGNALARALTQLSRLQSRRTGSSPLQNLSK